jgi:hypothetical protein
VQSEPAHWTTRALKEYVDRLHAVYTKHWDDKFAAAEKREASLIREINEWQDNANKWRELITTRERDFFPRNMGYLSLLVSIVLILITIFKELR